MHRGEDPEILVRSNSMKFMMITRWIMHRHPAKKVARERERERNGWNIETATKKQKESMSLTDDRGYHGGAGHRSEPESK